MFKETEIHRVSIHRHYFSLSLDQVSEYERMCTEMDKQKSSGDEIHIIEMNLSLLYDLREKAVVIPIVFSAMCLEAFIFDYAATHLGDSYVKKYLDKLDLVSKYIVISKLVTGNNFSKDGQAYQGLVTLAKDRNRLVHFKSKEFKLTELDKASQYHETLNAEFKKAMYSSIQTVRDVMKELDKLHGSEYFQKYIEPYECHV